MKPEINDEIIHRYLAGTATIYEKAILKKWLEVADNQAYFYKLLVRWEQQNPQFVPNVDMAIQRHFDRIQQNQSEEAEMLEMEVRPMWKRWAMVASMILLIGWMGWTQRDLFWFQTYQTNLDQAHSIQLKDGSRVILHPNSTLRVPRFGFGQQSREVQLFGEADFSVVHTKNHQQFVVKTEQTLEVVVLGTEFSVVSRKPGAKVLLNQGKVQLRFQQGPEIKEMVMKPGDLVVLDSQNQVKQVIAPEPQKIALFKQHRFDFNETSLREISHLFSEQFGVKVHLAHDSLATWTMTGSFSAQSADEMLETITEAANLRYRKEANSILIFSE